MSKQSSIVYDTVDRAFTKTNTILLPSFQVELTFLLEQIHSSCCLLSSSLRLLQTIVDGLANELQPLNSVTVSYT